MFHSLKSCGFESIIELFRKSCCNHLNCVSGLFELFTSHPAVLRPTVSNNAASTMSSRPEPFMSCQYIPMLPALCGDHP